MLNGTTISGKITSSGIAKKLLASGKSPPEIIEQIYVRCLSRKPTPQELVNLQDVVAKAETPVLGLEDVLWAIMNSREFLFNH
jgi:hypothetical protein